MKTLALLVLSIVAACGSTEATCPAPQALVDGLCVAPTDAGPDAAQDVSSGTDGSTDAAAPPTVTATTPMTGVADAELDITLTATFSAEMDAATINASTFVVSDVLGDVTGAVTFDAGTRTATFTPERGLGLIREYTAKITTGAASAAGASLAADFEWDFTTRDGVMGAPSGLAPQEVGYDGFSLVVAPSGEGFVGWSSLETEDNIWSVRFDQGSGWKAPTPMESLSGHSVGLSMSRLGEGAIATWRNDEGIWSNRTDESGEWGVEQRIGNTSDYPLVSGNTAGDAIAWWTVADRSSNAAKYRTGSGWGVGEMLGSSHFGFRGLATMDDGDGLFVFGAQTADRRAFRVFFHEAPDLGDWTPIAEIDLGLVTGGLIEDAATDLVTSGSRVVLVGSSRGVDTSAPRPVWLVEYEPGAGWEAPEMLGTSEGVTSATVAVDKLGGTYVLWSASGSSPILFRERSLAGVWSPEEVVGVGQIVTLSADPVGNLTCVYREAGTTSVLRRSPTGEWSRVAGSPFADTTSARFEVDDLGRGILVLGGEGSVVRGARFE